MLLDFFSRLANWTRILLGTGKSLSFLRQLDHHDQKSYCKHQKFADRLVRRSIYFVHSPVYLDAFNRPCMGRGKKDSRQRGRHIYFLSGRNSTCSHCFDFMVGLFFYLSAHHQIKAACHAGLKPCRSSGFLRLLDLPAWRRGLESSSRCWTDESLPHQVRPGRSDGVRL